MIILIQLLRRMAKGKTKEETKITNAQLREEPQNQESSQMRKNLTRSSSNIVVAGVAAGLAEYLNIDPVIIRIAFVLITIWGGSGLLLYIILWIIMPEEKKTYKSSEEMVKSNAQQIKEKVQDIAGDITTTANKENPRVLAGIVLLVLGVLFLLSTFGVFNIFQFFRGEQLWPLVLVVLGIILLVK